MEGLSACECPVCFLLLNSELHLPMSMPCGHTLCKICVQQLSDRATNTVSRIGTVARPTFQCPICRQWVNVDSVSLNVTLRDLLAELGRMEETRTSSLGTALNVNYREIQFAEALDRGAFGEVYRARWRAEEVAVKLLAAGRLTPEAMQAFQREVFVMNCLRHPNVVLLLGACQTPPHLAIIMEFVAGGSLHQLIHIEKASLSPEHTALLTTDVCRGLQYLHSINVMHRDLKSKNVLLTGPIPCQAKLCDFGLARMRQESATMTGNVGTVHWTAPEILNNQRYQFPADVYGFGMVLYEVVSGRVPLGHMNPMAVMLAVAVRKEQPAIPDDAHPVFKQLIKDCIQWDASARPSLPHILSLLGNLLPQRQNSGGAMQRGKLEHQDSLGIVFLSATDSDDLANQDSQLVELAHRQQAPEAPPTSRETTPLQQLQADYYSTSDEDDIVSIPPQAPPPHQPPLHHRLSYEDLFLLPDVEPKKTPPTQQKAPPTLQKAPPLTDIVEDEATSYNMAVATQLALPLGESSAPWPRPKANTSRLRTAVAKTKKVVGMKERRSAVRRTEDGDQLLARELQREMDLAQMAADHQLARQLQLKENTFQAPGAASESSSSSVFPPRSLLESIKSMKAPRLKHVTDTEAPPTKPEATPTKPETTPTKSKLDWLHSKIRHKTPPQNESSSQQAASPALSKKATSPPTKVAPHLSKKAPPPSKVASKVTPPPSKVASKVAPPPSKVAPPPSKVAPHGSKSVPPSKPSAHGKKVAGRGSPSGMPTSAIPQAPPPPPVQHVHRPFVVPSPRQQMMKELRAKAPTVAKKLKPVQTVEKRAFRVGRVVGGYDSELSQYTFQNLIMSFSRRRLRHVEPRTQPTVYPVGKVVQRRQYVKRLSSLIDATSSDISPTSSYSPAAPPPPPLPPVTPRRRQLHPTIRAAIERYRQSQLHHVVPVVKQSLPDERTLEMSRKVLAEEGQRRELLEEIQSFDHTHLRLVETVVANSLPSASTIEQERQLMEEELTTLQENKEGEEREQEGDVNEEEEEEEEELGLTDHEIWKDLMESVVTFDPTKLHDVQPVVKNTLPTIGTIELEKRWQN